MSYQLDDYCVNRTKRKGRQTYPTKRDYPPPIITRKYSFPSTNLEDESSEKYIVKEYSRNRLKKEIIVTKRTKIHSTKNEESDEKSDEESEAILIAKCLAVVSRKVIRILCYLGVCI